ncbi:hypothetical protein ACQPXS_46700 (plasmid) [Streptomyces sp. CA-142005]|uniref:hypothetical protein n=1 Tax=Streptomyces sp. CA-142005 TaxID=3240052 RepID=UPI003D8C3D9B
MVGHTWKLRGVMAAYRLFTITEPVPPLHDRSITLPASQVHLPLGRTDVTRVCRRASAVYGEKNRLAGGTAGAGRLWKTRVG